MGAQRHIPGDRLGILRIVRPVAAAALPLHAIVHHEPHEGGCLTVVTRVWEDRTAPTCGGLCSAEACVRRFVAGVCQVVVPYYVPADLCSGLKDRPGG